VVVGSVDEMAVTIVVLVVEWIIGISHRSLTLLVLAFTRHLFNAFGREAIGAVAIVAIAVAGAWSLR
jgi:hypothetical protein